MISSCRYSRILITKSFKSAAPYSTMERPKVYVTRSMNNEAMEILKKNCQVISWPESDPVPREELIKNIESVDGLFCFLTDKIDKGVLDKAKSLKVIATMSVGYDHLDLKEIMQRGIKVGYTAETLTDATAELTVALLLATSRRLIEANGAAREGMWRTWSPFWLCGKSLKNATIGFFGFGRIGQEVARRLKPFKPKSILYTARSVKSETNDIGTIKVEFEDLLKQSDFLITCCSYNEQTHEKFNIDTFKKMKRNSIFINPSRGGIVKQDDLLLALKEKIIWGAGLDVTTPEPLPTDHELFKLENCVVLPHIGSATEDCRLEMAMLTAENIISALKGETMPSELIIK